MTRLTGRLIRYSAVVALCLVAVPWVTRTPQGEAQQAATATAIATATATKADPKTPGNSLLASPASKPSTRPAMKLLADAPKPKAPTLHHPLTPTTMPQEPAPLASILGSAGAPQPGSTALVRPVSVRDWLPPANPLVAPRMIASDGRHAAIEPRDADLPDLAFASTSNLPEQIRLPAGSLVSAPSVDVDHLFAKGTQTLPDPHVASGVDPTGPQSMAGVIAAIPPIRQTPAPFTVFSIPQPQDTTDSVAVHEPLPDNDAPVAFWDVPARPPLPVAVK